MKQIDVQIWHHLTRAANAILHGKRQIAITEARKALELLQS